jgi:hypothetical protein
MGKIKERFFDSSQTIHRHIAHLHKHLPQKTERKKIKKIPLINQSSWWRHPLQISCLSCAASLVAAAAATTATEGEVDIRGVLDTE